MIRYSPFWLDTFPKSKRPAYPRWRGNAETRVVVIGGGLTGCACAYSIAGAGIPVMLLEADRIGAGATAASAGLVREDFDASFDATVRAHGLRSARSLWQSARRASLDFAAALRRLHIRCDLAPLELLRLCRADADAVRRLRREYQSQRDAGFDQSWVSASTVRRETALEGGGAIKSRGFAIDPYRACLGLAAAAATRKAQIFERSPVRRIRDRPKGVEIVTEAGTLQGALVIVATGARLPDLRALRRHLRAQHGYAVVTDPLVASVRRDVGQRAAAIQDDVQPPHTVRWLKDDRVVVTGGDQSAVATRAQPQVLVQRTGQLMYELSMLYPPISGTMPAWAWHSEYDGTADGLPYLGPHRNFPRHFFALGQATHGAGIAWLAGRLALRAALGTPEKTDGLFGFSRIL
jgi:glycine/D-amino acid oxidase-like deaminating enzyme